MAHMAMADCSDSPREPRATGATGAADKAAADKAAADKAAADKAAADKAAIGGGGGGCAGGCFPACACVVRRTASGQEQVTVEMLATGDEVLAWEEGPVWSRIAGWTYRNFERVVTHTELSYAGGRVLLAPVHFLPVRSSGKVAQQKAETVRVSDFIQVVTGSSTSWQEVVATRVVQERGQFDFVTLCGTVVVDNVTASCYAKVPPALAHRLMAPLWQPVAHSLPLLMTDQVSLMGCQSLWRVVNEWYTSHVHDEAVVAAYCEQWDRRAAGGQLFTPQDTLSAIPLLSDTTTTEMPHINRITKPKPLVSIHPLTSIACDLQHALNMPFGEHEEHNGNSFSVLDNNLTRPVSRWFAL